ncbi:hypothetical protein OIU85_002163 [Salix viminalis]|uniref:Fe2OG dioxygenase domain-containing protein n=1 Tax=Salix viminalis TaxID=40686 RepID=A0A9Q0ZYQ7_SALVM|nr:hypothetical protein OIU85_002163 [Salix viminalis]
MAMAMAMASSKSEGLDSVISVLELIKEPMISVPHNYVQIDQQNPTFPVCSDHPLPALPTIDFKLLVSDDTSDLELEKLHSSCKEWGFFQLVNHGVSSSLMNQLKHEIVEYYNLPFEEKRKYTVRPNDFEGYGNAKLDGKLDWGDRFFMITNPVHRRKPHLLPELPPSFRNPLECYLLELQRLAMKLLGFIAEALKVDLQEIEEMFDDGFQSVRMTNYPPCPQPELAIGFRPHSDGAGITILNQVNGVDGLQIKKDGVWIPMKFIPDALVVNVGDILEILSNGVYKSVEHRVTTNPEKERISVAFFVCPKLEAEVGPVTSLISPQNPPLFRRTGMEKYCKDFFSRKLHAKSFLETMKIESTEEATLLHGSR